MTRPPQHSRRLIANPEPPPLPLPATHPAPNPQGSSTDVDAIREAYREGAVSSNQELDFARDEADAKRRFAGWRSWDPFPEVEPALLNAAAIADYVSATGMIYPFRPEKLKPASYEVAIQGEYVYFGPDRQRNTGTILPPNHPDWDHVNNPTSTFCLNGNSIAFVSLEPLFQLPDYIAIRFNLKIKHVYKGLLLGTGPLVDPGYVGKLNIPLHNLTAENYEFEAGTGLIWVEFTKLNRHALWDNSYAPSLRQRGQYVFFEQRKTAARKPDVDSFLRDAVAVGQQPRSSLPDVVQQTKQIADEALATANSASETTANTHARLRRLGLLSAVGAIFAAVGIIVPTIALVHNTNVDMRTVVPRQEQQERRVIDLENQVNDLKARLSSVAPAAPPTSVAPAAPPTTQGVAPRASKNSDFFAFVLVDLLSRYAIFAAWLGVAAILAFTVFMLYRGQ